MKDSFRNQVVRCLYELIMLLYFLDDMNVFTLQFFTSFSSLYPILLK